MRRVADEYEPMEEEELTSDPEPSIPEEQRHVIERQFVVKECVSPRVFDAIASSRMAIEKFRGQRHLGTTVT